MGHKKQYQFTIIKWKILFPLSFEQAKSLMLVIFLKDSVFPLCCVVYIQQRVEHTCQTKKGVTNKVFESFQWFGQKV
jgi:hypothetical protein